MPPKQVVPGQLVGYEQWCCRVEYVSRYGGYVDLQEVTGKGRFYSVRVEELTDPPALPEHIEAAAVELAGFLSDPHGKTFGLRDAS